jgi:hypothetical protein
MVKVGSARSATPNHRSSEHPRRLFSYSNLIPYNNTVARLLRASSMAFALESTGLWALPQYNSDPGHGHAPPPSAATTRRMDDMSPITSEDML